MPRDARALDFGRFIAAVMEPLPDVELIDTAHNGDLRNLRRVRWRRAHHLYRLAGAIVELRNVVSWDAVPSQLPSWAPADVIAKIPEGIHVTYHRVTAELLRTPAPDAACVAWKMRQRGGAAVHHLVGGNRIAEEDGNAVLDRIIAEDEAWLAAHPVSRRRGSRADG